MMKKNATTGLLVLISSLFILTARAQVNGFNEDFAEYAIGASARSFKTNGAATVAKPGGQQGKWLLLQDKATYKLAKPVIYPESFTIEFDLLAQAEQIKDISPVSFGFVQDNAAREHISNGGAFVQLHYYDGDAVNVGNYALGKEINTTFDLSTTANNPLHIKLVVHGHQMAVYLNSSKLTETILFPAKAAKNFYISGPWSYEHGAQLYISNFKLSANASD